ncbi:MAG: Bifunctional protein FolD [Parcubacteria group bacterium GW2011_GWA1_59_11]|nr:MAG: Bifunctional protein FolD [Parcubacteria group bacterium GW2011_GWA1_59_11]
MFAINGKEIAERILADISARPRPDKFMGAALAGDDPASLNFLKQKAKAAADLGIDFRLYQLSPDLSGDELRRQIGKLAGAKACGGFLVQLPLPEGVNPHYVLNAIPKNKDVDLLSEGALGAFYTGRHDLLPPSVATVKELLSFRELDLRKLDVVLLGAGFLVGKPVGFWLENKVAALTVIDSRSPQLRSRLKEADVVVSGAGVPNLITPGDLKDGALVIDFGWNRVDGKIMGDFNPSAGLGASAAAPDVTYTPTPGGTGPILVAKLFENFYALNR